MCVADRSFQMKPEDTFYWIANLTCLAERLFRYKLFMIQPSALQTDASVHAEHLLSVTENALLTGNFALFRGCFAFPNIVETIEAKRTFRTVASFKAVFFGIAHEHQGKGVTHIVRNCISAEFLNDQVFSMQHETRMIAHGRLINDAYIVDSEVALFNGRWQITARRYALKHDTPIGRLLGSENYLSHKKQLALGNC